MEYGIVYLLTNPVMPGLVKIGMTTQEDIDKRMKELYTTGVPVPFECQFACKVKKGAEGSLLFPSVDTGSPFGRNSK